MNLQFKVGDRIIVTLDPGKQKDLFKQMASAHEVFGEKCCGLCKSKDVYFAWRTSSRVEGKKVTTYEFPEMRCSNTECGARLTYGTINDDTGTLFPQRRLLPNGKPPGKIDKDQAKYGDHQGWTKWRPNKGEVEESE